MKISRTLQIEKRPTQQWLIFLIFLLPFLWGTLFSLLHLPSFIKYIADFAWVVLFASMLFARTARVYKKVAPLVVLVGVFFVYCLLLYLFNFESIVYFLWGTRNNFRFYVLFFAVIMFISADDIDGIFKFFDILFWINIPVVLIQYFVLGYEQDFLGGIFGVESGVNSMMIIFFTVVLSRSIIRYMQREESLLSCASKCIVALLISALAELKIFFVILIIILILAAAFTDFSWQKAAIFAISAAAIFFTSSLLVTLFNFENFLDISNIWELATQEHYSSEQTVNRLSAIPTLSRMLVTDWKDRVFGLGLGNCDTSSFEICNTPFYQRYGSLRYTYFSCAFLFLEVGYVGLALYMLFFVLCFFMIKKRIKDGKCQPLCGYVALITAILAIILIFYNSSLRAEIGYIVFFILALPFIDRHKDEMQLEQ